jgi:hypothetical protein
MAEYRTANTITPSATEATKTSSAPISYRSPATIAPKVKATAPTTNPARYAAAWVCEGRGEGGGGGIGGSIDRFWVKVYVTKEMAI